ncbi:MAG: hypothetical protein A3D96_04445 [Chlamydiae bacterium RIFCSPHIGHO2_12_FULL_44_59]|nr:MAG: hypothetical protein A2796_04220 [Chlamydiae bacterium RIFCSPHIGHO2_01_FULL_44_39]OGN60338.1 MAG: hypothetical protein A3D96_04445 [Chlamydiae bacterium RIFCSPHIGHO2_12_FULL_44_59]OGN66321.1 MAG: hypothetical protein A2978_01890 [Chlamydiae bacterium RIFCSPLOWO2_01_FULL_44_52]OGN69272.1 MAG: hypothetical protein A3I67_00750 [Chlamydiae bacterium RIFCSPLOWO2_02_FULL_45_22]OGN70212.1 MAG: hypothetical protein A3F79_01035 [Chlamydiae bacterium RIFCSPLOWO2_12_FULL_45_20]
MSYPTITSYPMSNATLPNPKLQPANAYFNPELRDWNQNQVSAMLNAVRDVDNVTKTTDNLELRTYKIYVIAGIIAAVATTIFTLGAVHLAFAIIAAVGLVTLFLSDLYYRNKAEPQQESLQAIYDTAVRKRIADAAKESFYSLPPSVELVSPQNGQQKSQQAALNWASLLNN